MPQLKTPTAVPGMVTDFTTYAGGTYTCHIKVSSVPAVTATKVTPKKEPQKENRLPSAVIGGSKIGEVRVTSGNELHRTNHANAIIRVASLGKNANKASQRMSRGHFASNHNRQHAAANSGYAELQNIGLDCVHVGQCWLDTGIALVGNKDVSFRLYCQRESTGDQQHALVIRLGSGGHMRRIGDGDCLIGLRARPEVSKKGHVHWTAIDCMCVIDTAPLPVLVSCGVAVLKRDPSTGKCLIAMKRCGQSIGFVSMRRQLKRYFSALAAYREPLVSPQDIASHFDMCCDFELELLSKPMTASNIKCLFDSRSPGPITYNEAWTSMFEKHQMYRIPALTVLEVYARIVLTYRNDTNEDTRRPWTLPKGNFRHMAASGMQSPAHCAVRELKAETSLEWSLDECEAAPSVTVTLPDSEVAQETFFLWRNDALPENGGQVGEKYWQWFEFDEAKRRSVTAAAILSSSVCHKVMGLQNDRHNRASRGLTLLQALSKPDPASADAKEAQMMESNLRNAEATAALEKRPDSPVRVTTEEPVEEVKDVSFCPLPMASLLAGSLKESTLMSEMTCGDDPSAVSDPSDMSDADSSKDQNTFDAESLRDASGVEADIGESCASPEEQRSGPSELRRGVDDADDDSPPDQTDLGITYNEVTGELHSELVLDDVDDPLRQHMVTTV